jgi:hypothetical protein
MSQLNSYDDLIRRSHVPIYTGGRSSTVLGRLHPDNPWRWKAMPDLLGWWTGLQAQERPAWLQAFAALAALAIGAIAIFREGHAVRRRERLEAQAIAVVIYAELLMLPATIARVRAGLQRIRSFSGQQMGQAMGAQISQAHIDLPPMLDRNIDRLFLLGKPAAPTCLQLVSIIGQFNSTAVEFAGAAMMADKDGWAESVDQLGQHLHFIDQLAQECADEVKPIDETVAGPE